NPEFLKVNPLGVVPVLLLESGEILTEASAILCYLGDLDPKSALLATAQSGMPRYRVIETLNFIATELHKGFSFMFKPHKMIDDPEAQARLKEYSSKELHHRFNLVESRLSSRKYILGESFSVADAYLFVVLGWTRYTGLDLSEYPSISKWMEGLSKR